MSLGRRGSGAALGLIVLGAGVATVLLAGRRAEASSPAPTPVPSPVPVTTTLPAPQNLTLLGASDTTLTYAWDPVPGATGYTPFVNGSHVGHQISTTATTITGLLPGTQYTLQVRAHAGSLHSKLSHPLYASTSSGTPTPVPTPTPTPLPTPTPTPVPGGFVSRVGAQLRLGGQPFRFTGINVYNANSTGNCWYAMASGSGLDTSLSDLGAAGATVFRAWFFQQFATRNGVRDWSGFDHTLAVAAAHGFKVIATLGNQWGDCDSSAGYKTLSWYQGGYKTRVDPGYTATYRQFVAEVVARYRDHPEILAWQLINETEAKDGSGACQESTAASALRAFADDVGGLIRSLDPNHLINLGSIGSGQCGMAGSNFQAVHASAAIDLLEFHDYNAVTTPLPGSLHNDLIMAANLSKPLFVGETGIPASVGLQQRASDFDAKFTAQFSAGVVGILPWEWGLNQVGDQDTIQPGDPTLAVLGSHP